MPKRQLTKGEYFGEQSLLYNTLRTATVIAETNATVLSISRDSLYNVLGEKLEYILYHNSQLITIDKSIILRSLNQSQIRSLLKCSTIIKYKAGDIVIPRGCIKCNKLIMILKGSIKGPFNDIEAYSCIGDKEISNKEQLCYLIDYIANSDTVVAEIDTNQLEIEIGGEINQATADNEASSALRKVQLLRCVSNEKIKALAQALRILHSEDKDIIVQQDKPGDSFYIIKSGSVKVYKNGIYIRDITKHDYFGERAILFNEPRTASIIASGSVDC